MYIQQLFNILKRPVKIFVNEIDLWDDFKQYENNQQIEFYIYITSSFSLYRFRNFNNIKVVNDLPKNQKFDGILINSQYILNKLIEYNNEFNFVITTNYLSANANSFELVETFKYQFLIYKNINFYLENTIKIIDEQPDIKDHTIYLKENDYTFDENYKPKVFIITPIYNQVQWTIKCVNSINKYAESKYEITHVLVDNGSNEENKNKLNNFIKDIHNINIQFINFDQPIGFVKATNAGINYALKQKADYIGLQNNDTQVSENWMSKLINAINGQIVAANPIILQKQPLDVYEKSFPNFPKDLLDKTPSDASNILTNLYGDLKCIVSRKENNYHLNTACFCSIIFKAEIFNYFLLDECFGLGYADDADYSVRLLYYNLKFVHVVNCAIKHYSQKTFSTVLQKDKIQKIQLARLFQAAIINKLNPYQEKSTVVYTVNPNLFQSSFTYTYYDLKNCDYVYITKPENFNKLPKQWKAVNINYFQPLIQNNNTDFIINYFKLNPNLLFRNYKKIIYINHNYKLNMFPELLNTITTKNNLILLDNNTTNFFVLKNKTNILTELNNIFNEYKSNLTINLYDKIKNNIKNISYLNTKQYLTEKNEISFSKIKIVAYYNCNNIIMYYRLFTPYNYLKYLGYDVTYIKSFDNWFDIFKNANYFIMRREMIENIANNINNVRETLLNIKSKCNVKFIYDTDDLLYNPPDFNPWYTYVKDHYGLQYYKQMCQDTFKLMDIITVSTDYLKKCLINDFKLNKNKIYVLKNYLDINFIDYTKIIPRNFNETKLTIGIISSSTHITNTGKNDDYSNLYKWFEDNINNYNFVFFGAIPNNLRKYSNVKFFDSCDYKQYIKLVLMNNIDICIASLAQNDFNKCKSNIKFIETCAFKIPLITNNISTYNENKYKFNNINQLNTIIKKICSSQEQYHKIIEENYNYLLKNYTIENGIYNYIKMFQTEQLN